jgi:hypothetical protein
MTEQAKPDAEPGAEPGAEAVSEPGAGAGALTWDYDIPLVNNLFILRDLVIVLVLSLVIMQVLVLVVGFLAGEGAVVLPLKLYAIVGGVLVVLFLIAAGVVLANRHRTRFTVDAKGVEYEAGSRERKINRVVLFLSVLAGRPGAALIATSQESGRFAWNEIHKVTVHPRPRVITLSNSWRPVLRLYCPPECFGQTVTLVQGYAAAAAARRAARPREAVSRRRWWTYAAWVVGVAVAAFLGLADYDVQLDDAWRWLILAAVLILIAGLFEAPLARRLLALGGVALAIYVLAELVVDGLRPITGLTGMTYGRHYEVDTWLFVLSIVGQVALIGMGAWRLSGKSRRSALNTPRRSGS